MLRLSGPPADSRPYVPTSGRCARSTRCERRLGLHWADADAATLKKLAAVILAQQQADGAWSRHDGVATDTFATGQSLYVLAKACGVSPPRITVR